ncbi:hypothetical protein FPQ18DRAFT_375887 [Pyronema domesticum]|nr:hypothetical protein FPQ18DRAFT_375887 [Pyronema domesticum]
MPSTDLTLTPRYALCTLLQSHRIPFTLFLEDALHYYGVPTIVSDLFLLCPRPDLLPSVLSSSGWKEHPLPERLISKGFNEDLVCGYYQTSDDSESGLGAVFLDPVAWNFRPEAEVGMDGYEVIPPLPDLLDSLISTYLSAAENASWSMWTNYLSCLIGYVYRYVPEVREAGFAGMLREENRQYHADELSGMSMRSIMAWRWEREVRERIRRGDWVMKDCSVDREDGRFFPGKVEKGLLEMMGKVAGTGEGEEV